MMGQPQVSILMPVHNEEKYLSTCLNSIIHQTFTDWELIAIDDFSNDRSWDILTDYSISDDRIQIFKNDEKGIIPALQKAFKFSKGLMITRMDADDIMVQNKLEVMSTKLNQLGFHSVVSGKVKYFSDDQLLEGYRKYEQWINKQEFYFEIFKECTLPSACWMAYRSDIAKIGGFQNLEYPEDYDLLFKFYKSGFKIYGIDQVLHQWRDHPERASRNDPNYSDQNFFHLKVKYFLELEKDPKKQLIVWGAGRKGKQLVKEILSSLSRNTGSASEFVTETKEKNPDNQKKLSSQNQTPALIWVTENQKKIGHNIYGLTIQPPDIIKRIKHKQVIICISQVKFKSDKKSWYDKYKVDQDEIYEFC